MQCLYASSYISVAFTLVAINALTYWLMIFWSPRSKCGTWVLSPYDCTSIRKKPLLKHCFWNQFPHNMAAEKVEVDAMSDSPTDFWNSEKEKRTVMRLKVRTPKEPQKNDKVSEFFCWLLRIDAIVIVAEGLLMDFFPLLLLWRKAQGNCARLDCFGILWSFL